MAREKLNRVSVFRTSDGKLIESREEYLAHERKLKYGKGVEELVAEALSDEPEIALYAQDVVRIILNNTEKLRVMLSDAGKQKRRSRKKAVPTPVTLARVEDA